MTHQMSKTLTTVTFTATISIDPDVWADEFGLYVWDDERDMHVRAPESEIVEDINRYVPLILDGLVRGQMAYPHESVSTSHRQTDNSEIIDGYNNPRKDI